MEGRGVFPGRFFLACRRLAVPASSPAAASGRCCGRITDFQSHGIVAGERSAKSTAESAHCRTDRVRHICDRCGRCRTQKSSFGKSDSDFRQWWIYTGRRIVVAGSVRHEHSRRSDTTESEHIATNNAAGKNDRIQFPDATGAGCKLSESVSSDAADSAGCIRRFHRARWISICRYAG